MAYLASFAGAQPSQSNLFLQDSWFKDSSVAGWLLVDVLAESLLFSIFLLHFWTRFGLYSLSFAHREKTEYRILGLLWRRRLPIGKVYLWRIEEKVKCLLSCVSWNVQRKRIPLNTTFMYGFSADNRILQEINTKWIIFFSSEFWVGLYQKIFITRWRLDLEDINNTYLFSRFCNPNLLLSPKFATFLTRVISLDAFLINSILRMYVWHQCWIHVVFIRLA